MLVDGRHSKADVSKLTETFFLVCNLAESEEHAGFSYMKTGNPKFLEIQNQLREKGANT